MRAPRTRSRHATGLILGVFGVLLLSPDTLIIRLVDSDPWTFITWRGALMTIGMFMFLILRFGYTIVPRTYAIGWLGLLIAVLFALNNVFFQLSVQNTSVANTLVIIATAPLFAALFSVAFLRERVAMRTWIAIGLSALGVAMVFIGELGSGNLFGNVAALIASVGLGVHFVLVRLGRPVDMSPAIWVAGVFITLIGASMATDVYLDPRQFGLLAILGLVLLPLSFVLLTRAPHYISAPEVSLIILLETILGPLWVWLAISEEPPLQTVVGGALIIIVLVGHSAISLRDSKKTAEESPAPDIAAEPAE
jgi:drug/metabolite transporter (DMT)-like permease